VSGLTGAVAKVTVKLNYFTHTYPDDVDVLLVGPAGQKALLFSFAGGGNAVSGATLTFDDAAATGLPDSAQIVTGTFKPTNFGSGSNFPTPAPTGPYTVALSTFNGTVPNGVWSLYAVDHGPDDQGSIAGGWSLTINAPIIGSTQPSITEQP
jgi:hypothetical protein